MRYAVYEKSSGEILRVVICATDQIDQQVREGQAWIPFLDGSDATHYVSNGAAVSMPERPSSIHQFDFTVKQWFDPRSLEQLQDEKWAAIKLIRNEVTNSFWWDGSRFDSDPESMQKILGGVMRGQVEPDHVEPWTLWDNTIRPMSASDLTNAGIAMANNFSSAQAIGTALRESIYAATTPAELEAIVWPES